MLVIMSIGGMIGGAVCNLVGTDAFMSQMRFMAAVFGVFLAPLWGLYNDLKKLKDHSGVSPRQAREIDHRVAVGLNRLIVMFLVFVVSGLFFASAGLWPKGPDFSLWFARFAGAFMFLSVAFVFNIVINMRELSRFETKLERAKQDKERREKLLEGLRSASKGSSNNHAV